MENKILTRKQIGWINSKTEEFNAILRAMGEGSTFIELQSLLDACKQHAEVSTKNLVGVVAKALHFFGDKFSVENKPFILGADVPQKTEGLIETLQITNQVSEYRRSLANQAQEVKLSLLTSRETGESDPAVRAQAAVGGRTI